MRIKRIVARNYKTYRDLDLNLEVEKDRPIILIGGANGCGKTTLFDAIYHALYGLSFKGVDEFKQVFNAGAMLAGGIDGQLIMLEVHFSGMVLGQEAQYTLARSYMIYDNSVRESVTFNMNGNKYTYGNHTPAKERTRNEEVVNKIINANLPAELSNYFLFDAMKTSELVKEEQINKLIMKNVNAVMGFNKYYQFQKAAEALLAEKKAERLENDKLRKEYNDLNTRKREAEEELHKMEKQYTAAINYANDHNSEYEQLKAGRSDDEVTKDKIKQIEQQLQKSAEAEAAYRKDADALCRDLEAKVIYPKLASIISTEVEVILNEKKMVERAHANMLSDSQLDKITNDIVRLIEQRYIETGKINVPLIVGELKELQRNEMVVQDSYAFLSQHDVELLANLVKNAVVNPFLAVAEQRDWINAELEEMPEKKKQLDDLRRAVSGNDYTLLELYEKNNAKIARLKEEMSSKKDEIAKLKKKIEGYDYDIPQIPDPQYDMLCRLPEFFKKLRSRLLRAKKLSIENMMRDQLNLNLVVYAGYIGKVELSAIDSDDISFKIYHKNGNEIYLSQLNAGAKQTVMQVLLKVLYNLGDYDPPVMIDTVMGVLDKESREVILESYFPDLASQTILLSTDTEITTEHDFEKIQAYVAKTYTLHRDKENQCTTISDDYFGLKTSKY